MGESVGVWRPSHDWWDAFLQRYAAVLPPGVALFAAESEPAAGPAAGTDSSYSSSTTPPSTNGVASSSRDGSRDRDAGAFSQAEGASLEGAASSGRTEAAASGASGVEETAEALSGDCEQAQVEGEVENVEAASIGEGKSEGNGGRQQGWTQGAGAVEPWEVREARATAARLSRAL